MMLSKYEKIGFEKAHVTANPSSTIRTKAVIKPRPGISNGSQENSRAFNELLAH